MQPPAAHLIVRTGASVLLLLQLSSALTIGTIAAQQSKSSPVTTTFKTVADDEISYEVETTTAAAKVPLPPAPTLRPIEVIAKSKDPKQQDQDIKKKEPEKSVLLKTVDDQDYTLLCHHWYKDDFVISAEVLENGCKLECILLQSSGDHGNNFFDSSVTKFHALNEGSTCGTDKICSNGSCVMNVRPETGKAQIAIVGAMLPDRDRQSEGQGSDGFVKLFLDDKFIAKTKVIEDNNKPQWRQVFVTPLITAETDINMIVFDKDIESEELILGVRTTAKQVMDNGTNGTLTCDPANEQFKLCYAIAWFPTELI